MYDRTTAEQTDHLRRINIWHVQIFVLHSATSKQPFKKKKRKENTMCKF